MLTRISLTLKQQSHWHWYRNSIGILKVFPIGNIFFFLCKISPNWNELQCIRKYYHILNQYFMYICFVRLYCALYHDLWHIFEKRALLIIILNIYESFVLFISVTRGPKSCIVVYIFMPVQWNCKKKSLNLNFCHNFWTIRYIRFISEMHNELWNPCKLHQGQWPCDLWTAFLKTLTITITFEPIEVLLLYIYVNSLWWCLSIHTTNFDLHVVTLTLSFDLHI